MITADLKSSATNTALHVANVEEHASPVKDTKTGAA